MTLFYNRKTLVGSYNKNIVSGITFFIVNEFIQCKMVIDYEYDDLGTITIHTVNMTETVDNLTYYTKTSAGVRQTNVWHLNYTNVIGDVCPKTELMFDMELTLDPYRLFPNIVYAENIIVEPRYVNTNNNFITLVNIFNQNTQTMNAVIKSENVLSNDPMYNVGNMINVNTKHIIESLDDYMLMVSDMDKRDRIADIAITTEDMFIIPITSRMTIAIEFS